MRAILDALERHVHERPAAVAVVDPDGTQWSFSAIHSGAARVSAALAQQVSEGSAVAISVPSGGLFWQALLGVAACGALPVLLPSPVPQALRDRLDAAVAPSLVLDQDAVRALLSRPQGNAPATAAHSGVVLVSSGTTGRSRFLHRSAEAVDRVATTILAEDLCRASDRIASFLPMHHAFGFEHAFLAPLLAGATLRHCGNFSVRTALDELAAGATLMPLVPATAAAVAEAEPVAVALRLLVVAGAPLPQRVRAALQKATRVPVVDLYGASEVGTVWLDRGQGGRLVRGVHVRMVEPDVRRILVEVPAGSPGEIAVQSDAMLDAILGPEAATDDSLCEGFFRTGDVGVQELGGALRITGRTKLVFDVGGLKVNPYEVEEGLESHPAVRAALVQPVRLTDTVQRVTAVVELRDSEESPDANALREHLSARVPPHAVPRSFEFVRALPRTSSGKLLRPPPEGGDRRWEPVVQRPNRLRERSTREDWTRELFDQSANGYDQSSGVAFLGGGRWYRRRTLRKVGLRAGSALLDVGSGTGLCAAIAQEIVGPSGRVVALDPSPGMLSVARRRGVREIIIGHAESLPFDNATFDVVSMSYMLRHIDDLATAFAEARRVLRPGGRLVIFEVSKPTGRMANAVFRIAMRHVLPPIGAVASGQAATLPMMRYWAETIDDAVAPEEVVSALDRAGFIGTRHVRELAVFSFYRGVAAPA